MPFTQNFCSIGTNANIENLNGTLTINSSQVLNNVVNIDFTGQLAGFLPAGTKLTPRAWLAPMRRSPSSPARYWP
jgi:hypothetical protein